MSTFDQNWRELGMNMQDIRKAPEERPVIVDIILAFFQYFKPLAQKINI